ncbi:MAG: hypothetical protein R3B47_07690 [Bacteroidia bacterium]
MLLVILLVAYVFVSYQLGPVVASRLSHQIAAQSQGRYLEVKAARGALLQSSWLSRDLRLVADDAAVFMKIRHRTAGKDQAAGSF